MKTTTLLLTFLASLSLTAATDVVYLSNYADDNGQQYSAMSYYSNIDNSHNGQMPSDVSDTVGRSSPPHWQHWEGQPVTGRFNNGVQFTANIDANAAGYAVGQYAGYGSNGYHNYACFRDNDGVLWAQGSHTVHKIYYCKET